MKKKIDFSVRMGMLLSSAYRLIRNIVYALEGRHSVCNEVICPGDAVGAASDTVIVDNDLLRQIV